MRDERIRAYAEALAADPEFIAQCEEIERQVAAGEDLGAEPIDTVMARLWKEEAARLIGDYNRQEQARIIAEQERLDVLRAARANRSRWKNARRDFIAVRAERDELRAEVREILTRSECSDWPETEARLRELTGDADA